MPAEDCTDPAYSVHHHHHHQHHHCHYPLDQFHTFKFLFNIFIRFLIDIKWLWKAVLLRVDSLVKVDLVFSSD